MTRTITSTALVALLAGAGVYAQTTTQTKPPTTTALPQTQAPKPAPATPAAPAAPVIPPFQEGSKYAVVNFQYIANESNLGKSATAAMNKLRDQKQADIQKLQDDLKSLNDQKNNGAGVLSADALGILQQQIDRKSMDLNYAQQTAQKEMDDRNTVLQNDFYAKVAPVIQAVAKDKGVDLVFPSGENGSVVWFKEGLDLSAEVVKRLNATSGGGF
jgi:outer membrane protein